jgi:hypothetical protein
MRWNIVRKTEQPLGQGWQEVVGNVLVCTVLLRMNNQVFDRTHSLPHAR